MVWILSSGLSLSYWNALSEAQEDGCMEPHMVDQWTIQYAAFRPKKHNNVTVTISHVASVPFR